MGTHEDLISDAVAGSRIALAAYVRATQTDVWRYCSYLGHGHETEDLVQETYARALRSLHRYHGPAPAKAWLLAIARRVCADAIRAGRRRQLIQTALTRDHDIDHDNTGHVELATLVQQLPYERREAFVLTQILGASYDETAALLGVPIGTIRSRVARARQDLQHQLNQAAG